MGINPISNVNANMVYAVNAISLSSNHLSEDLIKKLKALGIDPSTVKSEEEAKTIIAQAEQKQPTQNTQQTQQVQPQLVSPNVDKIKLNFDIKQLGDKLNIDVKAFKELTDLVDKFDATVKEYENAASAQANKNAAPQFGTTKETAKISTGAEIIDKPEQVKAEFYAIKERVEKIEEAKKTNFAALDMIAAMNKLSLGLGL